MRRMFSEKQIEGLAQEQAKAVKKDIVTLVDADGNDRFQEWEFTDKEVSGVSLTFAKASLSGTHLMVVVAGTIADTTVMTKGTNLAEATLPEWIMNKIFTIQGIRVIPHASEYLYSSDDTQTCASSLNKNDGKLYVSFNTNITLNADRAFRFAFDLLIDSE